MSATNDARFLIVNADDFGISAPVNQGIIEAHEQGIVTSASMMVRWPAAADAADYSRAHQDLSVGLHVDLGEWVYRDDTWLPLYEVVPTDDMAAVAEEVSRQLTRFRDLVGQDPTHIDSHQHVHREEPARAVLVKVAGQLGVPLRLVTPQARYCGDFYGQTSDGTKLPHILSVERLLEILRALPPGITELACHPGTGEGLAALQTVYRFEREQEVKVLCDPRVREAIAAEGIRLCSFRDIALERTIDRQ